MLITKHIFLKGLLYLVILVLASVINLTGCASHLNQSKIEAGTAPHIPPEQTEGPEYVLQPGDVISVAFFYFPRLDTTLKIRPDGYISIAPIDDVKAAGLTSRELDEKLTKLYEERIENPEITVTVKEFGAQKVYVGGEVKNAGIYDLEMDMTALQAIFKAGGALNTGNMTSVVIIRRGTDDTPRVFTINLGRDLESKQATNDVYLSPLDVVYVPQTLIAKMDQFVDQYIDKLLPISLNAGFQFLKHLNGKSQAVFVAP